MFLRGQENSIQVRRMPVEVHWKDPDRSRSHRTLQLVDIDAVSFVDVDKDRPRAAVNHRFHRWESGVRWSEDFVAWPNAHRLMQHQSTACPIGAENSFFCPNVSGNLGFKGFAFLRQNVPAGIDRPNSGLANLFVNENAR